MSEDSSGLKFFSSWTAIQGSLVGILGVDGVHVGFGCEPALKECECYSYNLTHTSYELSFLTS